METKCTVCNQGGGHVLCDGCGKAVCFNCFHFVNSRRLCISCVTDRETKRRWQTYAQQYSKMTPDERAALWQTLSPEERVQLEGELAGSRDLHARGGRSSVRKYLWLALLVLACVVAVLLSTNEQLWQKATLASKKVVGSVKREVVDRWSPPSPSPPASSQQPGAIELVGQNLRTNALPITAGNLRMRSNPSGEGTIVYSPHYFGPGRRLAWIVIDGQAYALTPASKEITPTLRSSGSVPAKSWKKTGLSREEPLGQLQESLWN